MRNISFYLLGVLIVWFGLSYSWPRLYGYAVIAFLVLLGALVYNVYKNSASLFKLEFDIQLPPIFTLGDTNIITITFKNIGKRGAFLEPSFLETCHPGQRVHHHLIWKESIFLKPGDIQEFSVPFQPKTRGKVIIRPLEISYYMSPLLVRKTLTMGTGWSLKVYPSIYQMKQFNLLFSTNSKLGGRSRAVKRFQGVFSYELEQILPFASGDDVRKINWRVSGRKTELMVNRYQSDHKKDVYLVIDSSRPMMQEGSESMVIFEYAINMALMLANIILQKGDRCGLLVVGRQTETKVGLGGGQKQLKRILEALYQIGPTDFEGDFFKIESLVGKKNMLLIFSHKDQVTGIHSQAFNRIIKLFPTIPILFSESITENFKTMAFKAGTEYLSKRLG